MCAIFGALVWNQRDQFDNTEANRIVSQITKESMRRGRDGMGYSMRFTGQSPALREQHVAGHYDNPLDIHIPMTSGVITLIGNTRAEPTTEYVKDKQPDDQQPYTSDCWTIVHNGTIANDKSLREHAKSKRVQMCMTEIDSAAIAETLSAIANNEEDDRFFVFREAVGRLKGSYAILAVNRMNQAIYVAANYRPVWFIRTPFGVFFASTRESFPSNYAPEMVEPYSLMLFSVHNSRLQLFKQHLLTKPVQEVQKALVVCSGGLDSVVSAVYAQKILSYDVELFHVRYGSRAEGPEVDAIRKVAAHMGVNVKFMDLPVYSISDSPLLDPNSKVAGGEQGAEFAYEWVPARNLLLLALATAYAEANGFRWLVLGNNLEEAGAYPDNEPEFISRFNDLLPFAIGDGKKLKVIMPVGNMMKHEIVKLGHELNAPMHLTWSCYRAGHMHCGTCGPCFMRRTAFEINNLPEVISYEK